MSDYCVPLEGSLGQLLGRELKDIALREAPHGLLEAACGYIGSMLHSNPASLFESVLLPASRTDGKLVLSIGVREGFSGNLAIAARDYCFNSVCHEQAPATTRDSAAQG